MPPQRRRRPVALLFIVVVMVSVMWFIMSSVAHNTLHDAVINQLYKALHHNSYHFHNETSGVAADDNENHDGGNPTSIAIEIARRSDNRSAVADIRAANNNNKSPYWQSLKIADGKKKNRKDPIAKNNGRKKTKHPTRKGGAAAAGGGGSDDEAATPAPPLIVPVPANEARLAVAASELRTGNSLAYLIILSNEDFVDGALVLGASLRMHSKLLQDGKADLVTIAAENRLSRDSHARMLRVGFTHVAEVPSLASRAPKAFWKDTFDKVYMFNMTQYKKVVFMDADMVCVRSMDPLFEKDFGDHRSVGAIGNKSPGPGGETYFQTGMMVIQPSAEMFGKIMDEFETGIPPQGNKYNHGMNGRDGVLLRNVFKSNFHPIDNKYSRNLNPRYKIPASVISLHLRGKHKPWFDRRKPNEDPELGKKEFGFPYVEWWRIYEERVHKTSVEYEAATKATTTATEDPVLARFGGPFAGPGVSPLTHVWMMRNSPKQYVQLISEEDRRIRNKTLAGLQYVAGAAGQSCVEVCAALGDGGGGGGVVHRCAEEAFNFTTTQDCDFIKSSFSNECAMCEMYVYWRPHPGNDFPGLDLSVKKGEGKSCKFNLMYDERSRSTCIGRNETTRRLCPCV